MSQNKKIAQAFHDLILNEGKFDFSSDLVCEDVVFFVKPK